MTSHEHGGQRAHLKRVLRKLGKNATALDRANWDYVSSMVSAELRPALVLGLHRRGLLSSALASYAVPLAWGEAAWPRLSLAAADWRTLFAFAGFTIDCTPAPRPAFGFELYRGQKVNHPLGWSWTPDIALAKYFALGYSNRGDATAVYVARPRPESVLAIFSSGDPDQPEVAGRIFEYSEWLLDPESLVDVTRYAG